MATPAIDAEKARAAAAAAAAGVSPTNSPAAKHKHPAAAENCMYEDDDALLDAALHDVFHPPCHFHHLLASEVGQQVGTILSQKNKGTMGQTSHWACHNFIEASQTWRPLHIEIPPKDAPKKVPLCLSLLSRRREGLRHISLKGKHGVGTYAGAMVLGYTPKVEELRVDVGFSIMKDMAALVASGQKPGPGALDDITFENEKQLLIDALLQGHAPGLQALILVNEECAIDSFASLLHPLVARSQVLSGQRSKRECEAM